MIFDKNLHLKKTIVNVLIVYSAPIHICSTPVSHLLLQEIKQYPDITLENSQSQQKILQQKRSIMEEKLCPHCGKENHG
ncbi:hypothetical protein BpHYR1_021963 [Brachionus plicatilis]|uniref:Uncharacterized protein n=1 Tax=Brachionus plicatilis TaxID=10195 RepID=A0A3M7QP92_BRAPC|nr:hypothetical protein BpHYR1_021963 [Brachionus plicatilis]